MDSLYRDVILDHYRNPRRKGRLEQPDVSIDVENPLCGDRLHFDFRFEGGRIADLRFDGRGCAISQASASLLGDEIAGMAMEQAGQLDKDDILDILGVSIGPARMKCALLSL